MTPWRAQLLSALVGALVGGSLVLLGGWLQQKSIGDRERRKFMLEKLEAAYDVAIRISTWRHNDLGNQERVRGAQPSRYPDQEDFAPLTTNLMKLVSGYTPERSAACSRRQAHGRGVLQ